MGASLDRIRQWLRREERVAEDEAEGGSPVATPPPGAGGDAGESERETSTNAQMQGASDEPWSGSE